MLHKFSSFLVLAVLLMTTACIKIAKKNENQDPAIQLAPAVEVDPKVRQQNLSSLEPTIEYTNSNGRIQVQIHWPSSWNDKIKLEITDLREKKSWTEMVRSQDLWTLPVDSRSSDFSIYQIKVSSLTGHFQTELKVLSPISLKVDKDIALTDLLGSLTSVRKIYFHRLEIAQGKNLFIEDFPGHIIVEDLLSEEGTIRTFSSQKKAVWPHPARDAGRFKLDVQQGIGNLNVIIQGENGADGAQGAAATPEMKGRAGVRGEPARFEILPSGNCITNPSCHIGVRYRCVKPGGRGGRGYKGQQGFAGADGLNGGSTYPILFQNFSADLKLTTTYVAGVGGRGGLGGAGGMGGDAGEGSDGAIKDLYVFLKLDQSNPQHQARMRMTEVSEPCSAQDSYGPGDEGDTGPQGRAGEKGQIFK